jgi:hypothetical protein
MPDTGSATEENEICAADVSFGGQCMPLYWREFANTGWGAWSEVGSCRKIGGRVNIRAPRRGAKLRGAACCPQNGRLIEWGDRFGAPFGLTSARWRMLGAVERCQELLFITVSH